jgi:hypothetical protein
LTDNHHSRLTVWTIALEHRVEKRRRLSDYSDTQQSCWSMALKWPHNRFFAVDGARLFKKPGSVFCALLYEP